MNKAYLLTGGNLGNPLVMLQDARKSIEACCGRVVEASAVYRTAAWGKTDQPDFLNQVLVLHTELNAPSLLEQLQKIEQQTGRQRIEKYGPRLLDIDILLFNDAIIQTSILQVPHPQMGLRRFVLVPLAEVAQDLVHPTEKITIKEMLARCPDNLYVHKL